MIGKIQSADPAHTSPIMMSALFLVRRLKYRNGDVMDQYRSTLRMNRFRIDAVDAV
jgi:hypothetical protein